MAIAYPKTVSPTSTPPSVLSAAVSWVLKDMVLGVLHHTHTHTQRRETADEASPLVPTAPVSPMNSAGTQVQPTSSLVSQRPVVEYVVSSAMVMLSGSCGQPRTLAVSCVVVGASLPDSSQGDGSALEVGTIFSNLWFWK